MPRFHVQGVYTSSNKRRFKKQARLERRSKEGGSRPTLPKSESATILVALQSERPARAPRKEPPYLGACFFSLM